MTMEEDTDLKQGLLLPSEKQAFDDDTEAQATVSHEDETEAMRCPMTIRTSILALLAVLSFLWFFSASVILPARHSLFAYYSSPHQEHEHHHKNHHHSHGNDVTVHAGDVFMIQWTPDITADHPKDSTISLYLHCGGKMGTLVIPIAVEANDTGRHYWTLPVDLVESDNYSIKFVPSTCRHKKHARPVFYSQTFTVKQRVGRVKRQDAGSDVPAATTAPIPSVTVPTTADTPTTPAVPTTPTTPAVPTTPTTPAVPTTPTTPAPPASTSSQATTAAPPTSEQAPPPTTGESLTPSSSGPGLASSSGIPALTSTTVVAAPPPAESSSTSTSFSQVLNTVVVTVTSVNNAGVTITAVQTAVQTSEMAVGTSVIGDSGGKKSSKGPIIGGVVGGLLIAGALIGLGVWFFLRKRRREEQRRYMTPAPDYVHDHAHKPSPPVSPYPDKSPTLPNLVPIPMPPPPRRARPNQPPPGAGLAPPTSSDGNPGHVSEGESQMSPISELPADQEPSELYAGPVPEDKLGAATTPPAGGYATHEPAPQYSAYVNGSNVGAQSNNPYFPPSANEASYRGVAGPTQAPRYPENPSSYGSPPTGTPYGSYQDRARMAYHDRGASMTSNTSAISGASPVSPNPGNPGGLQHSTSVASHGSGVSGVSGVSWNQRLEAGETASQMSAEGAKPDGTRYETSARGGAPSP